MKYNNYEINTLNHITIIFSALNSVNLNFFLDSGTLLKFIRNNKKLVIGSDIDIGILENNNRKLMVLKSLLEVKGFKFKLQNGFSMFYDFVRINFPNNYKGKAKHVDLYIYRKEKKYFVCKRPHKFSKKSLSSMYLNYLINFLLKIEKKFSLKIIAPIRYFLCLIYNNFCKSVQFKIPLKQINRQKKIFYEINSKRIFFHIPSNYINYLTYRYGPKWRIPNKNWKKDAQKIIHEDVMKIRNFKFLSI